MQHQHRLALIALLSLSAATALQATPARTPTRTPAAPAFNGVLFEEAVRARLGDKVKGYAFAVSDSRGIEARAAGGWAQDPADGNVKMSTTLPSAIGSATKMLSAGALLHLFERRALANASVEQQLDQRIWPQLPPKWRSSLAGKGLEGITYRQLLQHRSGFRAPDCGGKELETVPMLERGIEAADVGKRCYANFNVKLLRFLIPAIAYPHDTEAVHSKHEKLKLDDYTDKLNIELSLLFERFMRDEFFPRSEDRFVTTCRPQKDLPARGVALGYETRSDRKGAHVSTRDEQVAAGDYCPTQGSWYLSAEGLALYGRNLLYTDRWLSVATRRSLWDAKKPDDRFPWNNTVSTEALGTWPRHGGTQGGYRAALVMLPWGYVGAGLINSTELDSAKLAQVLLDAFEAATRGEAVARARHGLTLAEYQRFVSELDQHGGRVDWVDFYNVGGKPFVNVIVRPAGDGPKHYVRHDLDGTAYQAEVDRHVKTGKLRLLQLDSYLDRGQLRYAFVMAPGDGRGLPAYHGVDASAHQKLFDDYTARGFVPTSLSVADVQGERRFAATWARWDKAGMGSVVVKSTLDAEAYQDLADEMARKKRELVFLNSHEFQGRTHYSAIFAAKLDRPQVWRHGLSDADYERQFTEWTGKGYGLRLVTGAGSGSHHRYAAVWQR